MSTSKQLLEDPAATKAPKPPRQRRRGSTRTATSGKAFWARMAILFGFLAVWEAISRAEFVNPVFLPPPTKIAIATWEILQDPRVYTAFRVTGTAILFAFLIAVALGLTVGVLLGLNKTLRDAFLGPILFLLSTPKSVFLPIFLLLFGLGMDAKIAFGAFSAFFYVVTNVIGGVGMLEERHKRLAHAFRAPLPMYVRDIVLPSAMPGIFAALWFGLRQAMTGVLIAELFASDRGIGYLIRIYTNDFRTDRTLAVVLLLSILAILGGTFWERVEKRMNRWRLDSHT